MQSLTLALASSAVGLLLFYARLKRRSPGTPLPPGPPAEPFIGHLRVIPASGQAKTFHEWSKIYGDVVHLHSLGRNIIVLNSQKAATELLDKRGANYSDRPRMVIIELMGWWPTLVWLPYGKLFLKHRTMLQHYFGPRAALSYLPTQTRQAHLLAKNLMVDTGKHIEHTSHLSRYAKAIVVETAFGQQVQSDDDPLMKMGKAVSESSNNAGPIGNTPVDFLPWLRYFPSWFPGAYYGARAKEMYPLIRRFHDYPVELVQEQMADGTAKPSFLLSELERPRARGIDEAEMAIIKGVGAEIYAAGADTTFTTLHLFLLTMVLHPDCLRQAQDEIDGVVGLDRLPEYDDRPSLPYLEGILQETLRWQPAIELGIPHRSLEDDVYNGMFIPKGSTVIANTRAMTLDPTVYADPLKYDPTRFLPKPSGRGEPYPSATWGFGRRICPGRHLASASLWMAMATMVATLNISMMIGPDGTRVVPKVEFTIGLTQEQVPFPCVIKPRSERAKSLILSACT
ncbi:cytochrome P450 [Mycena rosella]|uniref:Cytochrome P450 n=1 Tax=Mycena rosella TaxID=1033263 RepID=A0AAD7DHH3_MYCRO|nr:cytochrome P450 [Mycena rosella]